MSVASQTPPTPRQMMEMAVEAMRDGASHHERGRVNPLVGAALLLPDGTTRTAHRALVRNGEHGEHSLFERTDLSHRDLTGSHLFVTLEPCSKRQGSAEIPCAKRIADARVEHVWYGIKDPTPEINGQGAIYLLDHGIGVTPFDEDLATIIEKENGDWLAQIAGPEAQALPRVDERGVAAAPVAGGVLNLVLPTTTIETMSRRALSEYKRRRGLKDATDSLSFRATLHEAGLLDSGGPDAHLTGLGALLLAEHPRQIAGFDHIGFNAAIHTAGNREASERFDAPLMLLPAQIEAWVRRYFPDFDDREKMTREKAEQLPFAAINEVILNAIAHRDYENRRAICHLDVTDEAIVIKSPGGPVEPLTLDDLKGLRATPHLRNGSLVYQLGLTHVIEEQNLGMKTLRALPEDDYPLPTYAMEGDFLVLTIHRSAAGVVKTLLPAGRKVSRSFERGLEYIATQEWVTTSGYAAAAGVSRQAAYEHIQQHVADGILEPDPERRGRNARYRVKR